MKIKVLSKKDLKGTFTKINMLPSDVLKINNDTKSPLKVYVEVREFNLLGKILNYLQKFI